MKKFRESFAAQLSVFVALLATLIFLVVFATNFYYSRKAIKEEAEKSALHELDNTVLRMSNVLNSVEVATRNMMPFIVRHLDTPDSMFVFSRLMLENNPNVLGCSIAFEPDYYQNKGKGKYFSAYSYRDKNEILTEQEGSETYQYQYMDWYQIAKLLDRPYWTDPYIDVADDASEIIVSEQMCTYSVPIYDAKDCFVGIVAVDISQKWLSQLLSNLRPYPNSHTIALGRGGVYLVHPDTSILSKETIFTETLDNDNYPEVQELGKAMTSGKRGMMAMPADQMSNGKDSYVFFTPLKRVGWSVAIVCPESDVFAGYDNLKLVLICIFIFGILAMMVVCILVIRQRVHPLEKLARTANVIARGNFTEEIEVARGDDEISSLSRAFHDMQHSLVEYIEELKSTTANKERIEGELRIAHDIQMGMIPKIFPTMPEHKDIDAYASLKPAKEVGGDLYDFLFVGKHFYFAVGDVSGKGVPASLIMAVCRNLFRTVAGQGVSPAQIVTSINDTMGENNESGMFITLFVGVVDLTTGHLTFCNAGHNPPVLVEKDGKAHYMDVCPNIPAGLFDGFEFEEQEVESIDGKLLFLYTDGLTEAEDKEKEQYGDDKLIEELNGTVDLATREVVDAIGKTVLEHANGAEQSDDLTMMAMKIKVKQQ